MTGEPLFPSTFLSKLIGREISVKSKWGPSYVGTLVSCDAFMNLQLRNTQEQTTSVTDLGEVLIRCNNVLYIREVPEGQSLMKEATE